MSRYRTRCNVAISVCLDPSVTLGRYDFGIMSGPRRLRFGGIFYVIGEFRRDKFGRRDTYV